MPHEDPTRPSVQALIDQGNACQQVGQWADAEAHYRAALARAGQDGTPRDRAHSVAALGELLADKGAFAEARPLLDEARQEAEAAGDPHALKHILPHLGRVYTGLGDYVQARAC